MGLVYTRSMVEAFPASTHRFAVRMSPAFSMNTYADTFSGKASDLDAGNDNLTALDPARESTKTFKVRSETAIATSDVAPNGRYLGANPALARICGYATPDDLIDTLKSIDALLYSDPARRESFLWAMESKGEVAGFEIGNPRLRRESCADQWKYPRRSPRAWWGVLLRRHYG